LRLFCQATTIQFQAKSLNDGFCGSDEEITTMSSLLLDVLIEIKEISGILGSGQYGLEGPQTSVDPTE